MLNARCLACRDTCQRRQNARVEPRRVERCEGGQLLGTRRQQDAPRSVCQIRGGPGGIGQHHTARGQGAGGAQQTVIFNFRRRCRRTDIARCLGGIRVGRVNAERRTAQQRRPGKPPGKQGGNERQYKKQDGFQETIDFPEDNMLKKKKIISYDYSKMLQLIAQMEERGLSYEQAQIEAFYAHKNQA